MAFRQQSMSTSKYEYYSDPYDQQESENDSYYSHFITGIIVVLVVFHVILMIVVLYFCCCNSKWSGRDSDTSVVRLSRADSHGGRSRQSSSSRTSDSATSTADHERAEAANSDVDDRSPTLAGRTGGGSAHRTAGLDGGVRPVTSWHTSLLSRVRQQLDRLSRSGSTPTPPRSADQAPGSPGLTNPGLDSEDGLPSYHDYVGRLGPCVYEADVDEDKPPSYDDVMKQDRP